MTIYFFAVFISTLILSVLITFVIKQIAAKLRIVDQPDKSRKIHKVAVPLLGGVAVFFSYFIALYFTSDEVMARGLIWPQIIGFTGGGLLLIIGGFLDDKFNLKPQWQVIFPLLAGVTIVLSGIVIEKITNPFGSLLFFGATASTLLTLFWILGMMYTTKLLDGIDGLVAGLGVISGFIIFLFTITTKYYQPDVGLMALIFSAACLGFLFFNFYPAKIFLGESGSLLIGYIIGVLAIISGGKIAIALLIMGIPMMDVIFTIVRRLYAGKNPFQYSDRKHLHHRFLDMGLSQRQTVLIYYLLAIIFGATALFLQSQGKVVALGILVIVMVVLVYLSILIPKKYNI
ncbi:MAG: MraY family glycosyltransferase [bacterium]|nr:MraY family glycosyltransferase [bacterium]